MSSKFKIGARPNKVIGSDESAKTKSMGRKCPIAWAVITGLVVGILVAAGAALLVYGGLMAGPLLFTIAGGAALAFSAPFALAMIIFSIRAHKLGKQLRSTGTAPALPDESASNSGNLTDCFEPTAGNDFYEGVKNAWPNSSDLHSILFPPN